MSLALILVGCAFFLLIAILIVIFLAVRDKRNKYSKPDQPFEYRNFDLSPEILEVFVKNCLSGSRPMHNRYIYGMRDYANYYDPQERRDMGKVFELKVCSALRRHLRSTSKIKLRYQLTIGFGYRLDLILFWKDINRSKRAIIIECKHSNSMNKNQKNKQIKEGIEQLYRYREYLEQGRSGKVDLLVICTSFPGNDGPPAQLFRNVLVINCYSMLGVFMDEVKKFHKKTITLPRTIN